jgi:hypothetical protein
MQVADAAAAGAPAQTPLSPSAANSGIRLILAIIAAVVLGVACVSLSNGAPGSNAKLNAAQIQATTDTTAAASADRAAASAVAAARRSQGKGKAEAQRTMATAQARASQADAQRHNSNVALQDAQRANASAGSSTYFAWYGFVALAFLWLVSAVLAGDVNPLALAMGLDNRLSTSKLQALLWTACVGFVYSMIYADRVITYGHVDAITNIPNNVLFALGLSVTSVVGAKAITSSQVAANPAKKDASDAPSYDPAALVREDGEATASLTKVQILFWTVVGIVVYVTSAFHLLEKVAPCTTNCTFPDIDTTLMLFMGLGHATYLGGKLVGGGGTGPSSGGGSSTPEVSQTVSTPSRAFRATVPTIAPPPAKPTSKTLSWGVDTSVNVTQPLIDAATAHIQKPAFWGRYLTGYPIVAPELALLSRQQIRLLPIYQRTTAHPGLLSGGTSGQQGAKDAAEAIALARDTHNIPTHKGIAIYADIEPEYDVSRYWLGAWIQDLTAAGYVAGIYCGSNQPGIIAGMAGLGHVDPSNVMIWSCMPHDTTKTHKADVPVAFGTPGFSVGGVEFPVEMWQYCLDFGDYDFNVCTPRAFAAMWQP